MSYVCEVFGEAAIGEYIRMDSNITGYYSIAVTNFCAETFPLNYLSDFHVHIKDWYYCTLASM